MPVAIAGVGAGRVGGVLVALHAVGALVPAALAVATGGVVATARSGGDAAVLLAPLLLVGALLLLDTATTSAAEAVGFACARRIDRGLRRLVRTLLTTPSTTAHLDDAAVLADAALAGEPGGLGRVRTGGSAAVARVALLGRAGSALACAVVVARASLWLAAGLLAASFAMREAARRDWLRVLRAQAASAPAAREADYLLKLALEPAPAAEVRLLGLGRWLVERREVVAGGGLGAVLSLRHALYRRQAWLLVVALGAAFAAYTVPGLTAPSAGALATSVVAGTGVFRIAYPGPEAFDIDHGRDVAAAVGRLRGAVGTPSSGRPAPVAPVIRFEGVRFAYPGHAPVLAGLDLEIRPGEVVGLVGVNGAGKTTLLTLLAGLLRPTGGRITADGVDIAALDPRSWRNRMGLIFQDFARYPLTIAENVDPADPGLARKALEAAGVTLPFSPDTPLLAGRADLSGGQWQQLALARAIAAASGGRDVIAFDEPTSHLDVRAETEFFDRVVSALPGVTLLLVSHRIATLRRADRIVVLDGGRVAESGSHEALLAAGGLYAVLFRTQAARFAGKAAR